jgi:hypothetical protein
MTTKHTRVEEGLAKLEQQSKFGQDYKELFEALLNLKRQAGISDIIVDDVRLPGRWYIRHPKLHQDMKEVLGSEDRLLGFNIKHHPND